MKVSFVICTKNPLIPRADEVIRRAGSLMKPGDELLVIENAEQASHYSSSRLQQLIGKGRKVFYHRFHSGTVGASRNIAFQRVRNSILIFFDDDVLIHPAMRSCTVAFFKKHNDAVVYVNPFSPVIHNVWATIACAYWNQSLIFERSPKRIRAYPLACSAVRVSFLKKHKIMCTEGFFTGEDMDLLLSIQEKGGGIYFDPQIIHKHYFATTMRAFLRKHFLYAKNYIDIQRLHPKTYLYVDNISNYKSSKNYVFPFNFLGSIRRILLRTKEFMHTNKLPLYYTAHVLLLMTTLTISVFSSIRSDSGHAS